MKTNKFNFGLKAITIAGLAISLSGCGEKYGGGGRI